MKKEQEMIVSSLKYANVIPEIDMDTLLSFRTVLALWSQLMESMNVIRLTQEKYRDGGPIFYRTWMIC